MAAFIRFFLDNKLITYLLLLGLVGWGLSVAPFDWSLGPLPRDPVAVDAIPDLGENQQIVFTAWPGRSPQDIEDQITYPLTTQLLGMPGVKSVRANSMLGFSSIYVIFDEDVEFYWSRARILEKLSALPPNLLPDEVQPTLGPDATALGQVFWYTLQGRDAEGRPAGGWDPHELRSIQDYQVRYALAAVEGVSEVASIGGHVQEYQIDVDPAALRTYGLSLDQVARAVANSNLDVGARTLEINRVEYLVRGLGYVQALDDLEQAVVALRGQTPIRLRDVAQVSLGPAPRRGILDVSGADAVGGVVVARYGANPMAVIQRVKAQLEELAPSLPRRELADGRISQVTLVPFYDRSELIEETLDTLREALSLEVLITLIVVVAMLLHLRASLLISIMLPVAVLMCFIAMRYFGITANIVALSGIAIAIGTIVDVGIILTENILQHQRDAQPGARTRDVVLRATVEVAPAILTAMLTTIVSFLPVFALEAAEGKLFRPLAFTKTFALVAAILIALVFLPALAHQVLGGGKGNGGNRGNRGVGSRLSPLASRLSPLASRLFLLTLVLAATLVLAIFWQPLGLGQGYLLNALLIVGVVGGLLGLFWLIRTYYQRILRWCLANKGTFLLIPSGLIALGLMIWLGFASLFGWLAQGGGWMGLDVRHHHAWQTFDEAFPGLGKEFMPALDEGAFLLMPTSMPHAGVEQNQEVLRYLDLAVQGIPEVERVVGKAGRVESALDPAPLSMYENVILYRDEYGYDSTGQRVRQWRDHIETPDDIWQEIVAATRLPGVTSAPKLQPIETRLVMLQTGMRAPMGIKVSGPDLRSIEQAGGKLAQVLETVPGVKPSTVFADRIVGKPYLELQLDRPQLARYGLSVAELQRSLQMAIGGMTMTTTVEGRERYAVRVRLAREYRDDLDAIRALPIATPAGAQVPLGELVELSYQQGPQAIKSENTFLVGYVTFDKQADYAETDVVLAAQDSIQARLDDGRLELGDGISYRFAGSYENQVRAEQRLMVVIPLCLALIFLLLYLQFRHVSTTLMVFSGIAVAFAGGFLMLWAYGDVNLSVAVWVGFIALFGIATDDGVLIATYLDQSFAQNQPTDRAAVREAVVEAGLRRVRPALMTSATTLLALLPVLTSTGRGSDVMVPMAIPVFGGMLVALITLFVVPTLYAWYHERKM